MTIRDYQHKVANSSERSGSETCDVARHRLVPTKCRREENDFILDSPEMMTTSRRRGVRQEKITQVTRPIVLMVSHHGLDSEQWMIVISSDGKAIEALFHR